MRTRYKFLLLAITALAAAGAVTWGIISYIGLHSAVFTGDVTTVDLIKGDNGSGIKSAIVAVRNEQGASVFEFTSDTVLKDKNNETSVFYYLKTGQTVTVKYDKSDSPENSAADFIAKSAKITADHGQ